MLVRKCIAERYSLIYIAIAFGYVCSNAELTPDLYVGNMKARKCT